MESRIRALGGLMAAAGVLLCAMAQAGPAEDASAATKEWVKAVLAQDIDTQLKLLPKALFAKPDSLERERKMRLHDKELALINGQKYLSFEVQPAPAATGSVGKMLVMIFPYRSVLQTHEGKLQRDSSLLAIAEQGSSNWSVIDGSGQNPRSIKVYVPGYVGIPPVPPHATKLLKSE